MTMTYSFSTAARELEILDALQTQDADEAVAALIAAALEHEEQ